MMKKLFIPLVLVCGLCINGTRCVRRSHVMDVYGSPGNTTTAWASDMQVLYQYTAGMTSESERMEVYADSAVYEAGSRGTRNRYTVKFTQAELNDMAAVFSKNDFAGIQETKTPTAYDKPGHALVLTQNGKSITKSETATSTFTGDNATRLRTIRDYVRQAFEVKLKTLEKPFTLSIDESVWRQNKKNFYVAIRPGKIIYSTENEERVAAKEYTLKPGNYSLTGQLWDFDTVIRNIDTVFTFDGKGISIVYRNNKLQLETNGK